MFSKIWNDNQYKPKQTIPSPDWGKRNKYAHNKIKQTSD